jgi:peptidoglycan/xylan/chitin deacetylase (PgdA/CDA1 family)
MEKGKKEKIFVNIVSNVLLSIMLVFVFVVGMFSSSKTIVTGANSEYNGTIYAGDKSSNKVSLMINVYWGTEYVEKMLDIFEKYNIKTTFFVGGSWAKENQELLKKIYEQGHEIGSHGQTHKEQGKLSYEANYQEIKNCHDIVKVSLGIDMELFAPPGGSYNKNTTRAATDLGYKTIMWTRDTIDWRDHDTKLIYNRAVVEMSGGDLILMHPTANTVEALEPIIEYAKNHGYALSKVSETLGL